MQAYRAGKITHSAVSMHFATEEYDRGPVFFRLPVEILPTDTPDDIGARVNKAEHEWQARITDHVVNGRIGWDGKDPRLIARSQRLSVPSIVRLVFQTRGLTPPAASDPFFINNKKTAALPCGQNNGQCFLLGEVIESTEGADEVGVFLKVEDESQDTC